MSWCMQCTSCKRQWHRYVRWRRRSRSITEHRHSPAHNDEITEVKQVGQTEHKCSFCSNKCPDNSKVLQCSICKALCHWACTKLPLYQLYMYELSSRKYSFESCVEIPESVRLEYASISDSKEENSKKKAPVLNKGIQTHSPVIPGVEEGTNTEFVKTFDGNRNGQNFASIRWRRK